MGLDDQTLRFVDRIYDSASDPAAWRATIRDTVDQLDSHMIFVSTFDPREGGSFAATDFIGQEYRSSLNDAIIEYGADMYRHDPTVHHAARNPGQMRIRSHECAVGHSSDSHRFQAWNEARIGANSWTVLQTPQFDGLAFGMSIHRTADQGSLEGRDERRFTALYAHFARAFRFSARPLFDCNAASLFVDDEGHVAWMTDPAAIQLARSGALRVERRQLRAARPGDDRALARTMQRLIGDHHMADDASLRVVDPEGVGHVQLRLTPLGPLRMPSPVHRLALRIDLDYRLGPCSADNFARVTTHYGLTPRERQLAALLVAGHSLESASHRLGISYFTARAHLRSLFARTATGRQAELIAAFCTPLPSPNGR